MEFTKITGRRFLWPEVFVFYEITYNWYDYECEVHLTTVTVLALIGIFPRCSNLRTTFIQQQLQQSDIRFISVTKLPCGEINK